MTRRGSAVVAMVMAAALVVASAACTSDVESPPDDEAAAAPPDGCGQAFDAALRAWEQVGFSGVVAVTAGGEPDCVAGYGERDPDTGAPNAPDTVFSIGSVTKAMTAAAVLGLVDDGRLALDDRVGDVLPELTGPVSDATVGQLLRHAGGLTGGHADADDQPLDRDAALAAIGSLPLAFPPGTGTLYSNSGYTLLAIVVEQVSGTTFRDRVVSTVLGDAGVAGGFWDGEPAADGPRAVGVLDDGSTGGTGTFDGPHWAVEGNGGVAMTVPDLAEWAHVLFTGDLLSDESLAAVTTPAPAGDEAEVDEDAVDETAGWAAVDASLLGEPAVAAAGGGGDTGHEVVVAWFPESDRVIAIASHTPEVTAEDLLEAVGPAIVAGTALPRPAGGAEGDEADDPELAALAGSYELDGGGGFDVAVDGSDLVVGARGPAAMDALFPPGERYSAEDIARHEDAVADLLAGGSEEGRDELEALASDLGEIQGVEVVGTLVEDRELRTYVTVEGADGPADLWYALDEAGGIAAAEITDQLPERRLARADDGTFTSEGADPTGGSGSSGRVAVAAGDGSLSVTGPDGTVTARLAG